jgi:hypothetical protein
VTLRVSAGQIRTLPALVSQHGFCQLLGPASRTARARKFPPGSIVVLEEILLDDAIP